MKVKEKPMPICDCMLTPGIEERKYFIQSGGLISLLCARSLRLGSRTCSANGSIATFAKE